MFSSTNWCFVGFRFPAWFLSTSMWCGHIWKINVYVPCPKTDSLYTGICAGILISAIACVMEFSVTSKPWSQKFHISIIPSNILSLILLLTKNFHPKQKKTPDHPTTSITNPTKKEKTTQRTEISKKKKKKKNHRKDIHSPLAQRRKKKHISPLPKQRKIGPTKILSESWCIIMPARFIIGGKVRTWVGLGHRFEAREVNGNFLEGSRVAVVGERVFWVFIYVFLISWVETKEASKNLQNIPAAVVAKRKICVHQLEIITISKTWIRLNKYIIGVRCWWHLKIHCVFSAGFLKDFALSFVRWPCWAATKMLGGCYLSRFLEGVLKISMLFYLPGTLDNQF